MFAVVLWKCQLKHELEGSFMGIMMTQQAKVVYCKHLPCPVYEMEYSRNISMRVSQYS